MTEKKTDDARVNRNPVVHNIGALQWDGERRGPELEDEEPDIKWCNRTKKWWKTWQESPQAMLMTDTDWEFMLETAFLHNLLWGWHMIVDKESGGFIDVPCDPKDAKSLAGEIRIRLEKMGATIKDRGSLGMRIQTSGADVVKEAEKATRSGVDYRKRLTGEDPQPL
ncbi:phage terminase small subunit [Micromonospora sp. CB01531]|uniref:phage terminase small subunit n=1 Tax=Micromonospora sp. CB01531 TaxID=1718947 RepID=UPI0011613A44|nr:hypothetical protein [Micromonospora sp. CB01531]